MAANDHVVVTGADDENGAAKKYTMSTCVDDMSAYQKVRYNPLSLSLSVSAFAHTCICVPVCVCV
jgi:hypothetical protein